MPPPPSRRLFGGVTRGFRPLTCAIMWMCIVFIAVPFCVSTAWLVANPKAARALAGLTAVFAPEVCDEDECNSFDGVRALGEHFLSTTKHKPAFRANNHKLFPWTKTLRINYRVFRDEYLAYTRSHRVPLHKEMGESQVYLAGKVKWRTIPLRLSYADTDFSKHFPKSMALIRKSGVDAFSVYVHYMARRRRMGKQSPSTHHTRFFFLFIVFSFLRIQTLPARTY